MGSTFVGRGVVDSLQRPHRHGRSSNADDAARREREAARPQPTSNTKYVEQTAATRSGASLAGVRDRPRRRAGRRRRDGRRAGRAAAPGRRDGAGRRVARGAVEARRDAERADGAARRDRAHEPRADAVAHRRGRAARPAARGRAAGLTDDVLDKLADAKFVTLEGPRAAPTPAPADFPAPGRGRWSSAAPRARCRPTPPPALAGGLVDGERRARGGGDLPDGGEVTERDVWIDAIATTTRCATTLSTIDDVDRVEGRVAATLALAELGTGRRRQLRPRPGPGGAGERRDEPLARCVRPAHATSRPRAGAAARLPGWRWSWRGSWGSSRCGSCWSPGTRARGGAGARAGQLPRPGDLHRGRAAPRHGGADRRGGPLGARARSDSATSRARTRPGPLVLFAAFGFGLLGLPRRRPRRRGPRLPGPPARARPRPAHERDAQAARRRRDRARARRRARASSRGSGCSPTRC